MLLLDDKGWQSPSERVRWCQVELRDWLRIVWDPGSLNVLAPIHRRMILKVRMNTFVEKKS